VIREAQLGTIVIDLSEISASPQDAICPGRYSSFLSEDDISTGLVSMLNWASTHDVS
jgi:hypothetical protein